jgi:uncharacterized protein (DUF58 family)
VTRVRLVPTGRGYAVAAVVVALLVAGRVTGSKGAVPLAAALGALVLAAGLGSWMVARGIGPHIRAVARARPGLVAAGRPAHVELRVTSNHRTPYSVGIERPEGQWRTNPTDTNGAPAARQPRRWRAPGRAALVRVAGATRGQPAATVRVVVPTERRAVLELAPRPVWIHDPAGLVGAVVTVTEPVRVVVHPHPAAIPDGLLTDSIGPASSGGGAGSSHGGSGDWGGDFAELRPYRIGDRLASVHWQALARYGVTLVCQFEPEASGLVRVVVDDRAGAHHRHTYEDALSIVEGLIEAASQDGLAVELSTFSGRAVTVIPNPEGLAEAQELLASMGPRPSSQWSHLDLLISEFGGFTLVTTATGAPRLPGGLRQRAHVVSAG